MQMRIPYTALDNVLIEKAQELFDKLYNKRMLIRLIGVRFSHLIQGTYQFELFNDMTEHIQLYQAMDKLRRRFGTDAVMRAAGMDYKDHSSFNPFNGKIAGKA
jgi:DNA polymerase-4